MTKVDLLNALSTFLEGVVSRYKLPTAIQKGDTEMVSRAPDIYKMRLDNSGDAKKKAPYIIVQYVTGKDYQKHGAQSRSYAVIRLIFAVYDSDEQRGAMSLLNLMETVRMELMKQVQIGTCFLIDTDAEVESVVYPEDTAPYYAGEMILTVLLPPTEREVKYG